MTGFSSRQIVWDRGVHLEGTVLWFDPTRVREFCGVSSTQAPLSERQLKILWSDRTARLLALRHGRKSRGLVCPYNRSFSMGNLSIELFPSGYVAGGAQFQITLRSGHKIVYTGPFSMRRNRTAEAIEVRRCDTLIVDATYGHERYRFPARAEVEAEVLEWTRSALAAGLTPILLVKNPGKAQDLIHLLGSADLPLRVHRGIYAFNKAYRAIGIDLPNTKQFRGRPGHGEVLIWPSHLRRSKAIRNLRKTRLATLTGLGGERGAARRLRVSHAFTWSGRSDFDGIMEYVRRAQPRSVVTTGRFATELAHTLSESGVPAEPIRESAQLDLI